MSVRKFVFGKSFRVNKAKIQTWSLSAQQWIKHNKLRYLQDSHTQICKKTGGAVVGKFLSLKCDECVGADSDS